jgi:hypothetical protein
MAFSGGRIREVRPLSFIYEVERTLPGEYYHWHVDAGPGVFSERQLVAIWICFA